MEIDVVVLPKVSAADEERSEVVLLVEEGEDADADAAGEPEQHFLRERLPRHGVVDAGGGKRRAHCCDRRDVAGEMKRIATVCRAGAGGDHVSARGGVALAGLFHAGADKLLEVFAIGHRVLAWPSPKPHALRIPASRIRKVVEMLEDSDPLYPHRSQRRERRQEGWAQAAPGNYRIVQPVLQPAGIAEWWAVLGLNQ